MPVSSVRPQKTSNSGCLQISERPLLGLYGPGQHRRSLCRRDHGAGSGERAVRGHGRRRYLINLLILHRRQEYVLAWDCHPSGCAGGFPDIRHRRSRCSEMFHPRGRDTRRYPQTWRTGRGTPQGFAGRQPAALWMATAAACSRVMPPGISVTGLPSAVMERLRILPERFAAAVTLPLPLARQPSEGGRRYRPGNHKTGNGTRE